MSAVLLIYCSESGLRERELIDILKDQVGQTLENDMQDKERGHLLRVPSGETPVALWWPPLFRHLQSLLVPS